MGQNCQNVLGLCVKNGQFHPPWGRPSRFLRVKLSNFECFIIVRQKWAISSPMEASPDSDGQEWSIKGSLWKNLEDQKKTFKKNKIRLRKIKDATFDCFSPQENSFCSGYLNKSTTQNYLEPDSNLFIFFCWWWFPQTLIVLF